MDKDVKGRLEDCVERSETTEKNSKATDESYPMSKESNHKGIIRTTSKMQEISKSKLHQKEEVYNEHVLTNIISQSLQENEILRCRVIELEALLAEAISELN